MTLLLVAGFSIAGWVAAAPNAAATQTCPPYTIAYGTVVGPANPSIGVFAGPLGTGCLGFVACTSSGLPCAAVVDGDGQDCAWARAVTGQEARRCATQAAQVCDPYTVSYGTTLGPTNPSIGIFGVWTCKGFVACTSSGLPCAAVVDGDGKTCTWVRAASGLEARRCAVQATQACDPYAFSYGTVVGPANPSVGVFGIWTCKGFVACTSSGLPCAAVVDGDGKTCAWVRGVSGVESRRCLLS